MGDALAVMKLSTHQKVALTASTDASTFKKLSRRTDNK